MAGKFLKQGTIDTGYLEGKGGTTHGRNGTARCSTLTFEADLSLRCRNPARFYQLRLVAYLIIYDGFCTSQVVYLIIYDVFYLIMYDVFYTSQVVYLFFNDVFYLIMYDVFYTSQVVYLIIYDGFYLTMYDVFYSDQVVYLIIYDVFYLIMYDVFYTSQVVYLIIYHGFSKTSQVVVWDFFFHQQYDGAESQFLLGETRGKLLFY